jgi:GT2 family glycosyltransferase
VDDGSTDGSAEIARKLATQVIEIENGPKGPANARNQGSRVACGEIIFFVDADVIIYPDTLQKVADSFAHSPGLTAVFGSYDDQPGDGHFLSQYKNLFHHFVHQQAKEDGGSFWSGCGAIRRESFFEVGGFDTQRFPRPSIEDIELGRRLKAAGHTILVNKTLQVKHLKRWTLTSLIKTDVFDRAIPWTQLIIAERNIPNDLNLEASQRWSALFTGFLLMFMAASALFHSHVILLPIILILFWVMLQCWQWSEQPVQFDVSWRSFLVIFILLATLVGLAIKLGFTVFLPAMLILLGIVIAGPWLTRRSQLVRQAVFAGMIVAIFASVLLVMTTYPLWLTALIAVILGVFILINRSFYAFFKHKRGIMFAAAVIPFHMLYFLYSTSAFVLGSLIYYRKSGRSIITQQISGKS